MGTRLFFLAALIASFPPESLAADDLAAPCEILIGDGDVSRLAGLAGQIAAVAGGVRVVVEVREKSCEAITRAVRALPASGGRIVLGAGEYICTSPLVIDKDNVQVVGAGSAKTLLKAKDGVALPLIVIGSIRNTDRNEDGVPYPDRTTRNVTLSGLSADGNYHSHPGKDMDDVECWDATTGKSKNCTGDAASIRNNVLTFRRAEQVQVSDFVARAGYSGGIVSEKYCKNLVLDGVTSTDNWYDGYAGYETTASVFRNFHFNGNRKSGMSTDIRFTGNVFENGEMAHNGDNGSFSANVGGNAYRNLRVHDNGGYYYYFDGARDKEKNVIPGYCNDVEISGGEASGTGRGGLYVNSSCRNLRVQNVKMKAGAAGCLKLAPGSGLLISGHTTCNDETLDGTYEGGVRQ